ncbi:MAG TPA: M20/M25/M40 family metallo-hydrolase [Pyrinomonadaceae bacterium]|nr:M20/M25/M40 family metallo-hydrolase [Pyrinomonadaceae bacterium]
MKKRIFFRAVVALVLAQAIVLPQALLAQTAAPTQAEIYAAIRKEGMDNSKIMHTLHILTDLYGPRLTGSPNHVNSAKWIMRELQSWGFENTALEPWEFGHPGWVNERNTGLMLSPVQDTLTYEVLAWTPSTKGPVTSEAVSIVIPTVADPDHPAILLPPTQAELTAYLDSVKSLVTGKIVLIGKPTFIDQSKDPSPKHMTDEDAKKRFDPANASTRGPGGPGGPNRPSTTPPTPRPGALTNAQVGEQLDKFLVDNNVLVRINESQLDRGAVRAFNNRTFDVTKVVPTVVMRNEDFGRIYRLLQDKTPVRLDFDLRSRIVPDGVTSYNVVGEIVGSDKKDEVIMLGGHLDSWHSATGATDNAIGCATMMEAARIIKAIGVKPRRTIRVACWSGEEEGLLGSQAYVKRHFGTAENPTAEFSKFNGYFNIDSGTGRARGLSVFGPPEAATVLRDALAPFADLGFAGVLSTKSRATGGTDSTSFNAAGLPGIGGAQDPIEYFNVTWHTNLDTYERIIESDVKASSIIFAGAIYTLAMRDEMLPRFAPADMPAAPTPTPTPSPTAAATPKP